MLVARSLVLAVLCSGICAHAQTHTLAVYSQPLTLDNIAEHSLRIELQRLLSPADLEVSWYRNMPQEGQPEVERLVVGSFQGSCNVEEISRPLSSGKVSAYAETAVSSGRVLPYFKVDCDRLVRTLAPMFRLLSVPMRQDLLGRALARVMAHEIYHIVGATTVHEATGVTKPVLTAKDLLAVRLDFSRSSLFRIRTAYSPQLLPAQDLAALVPPFR